MNRIALVVSDVDGTLVTPDKQLTDAARRAVARLQAAGIGFTLTSSRPPLGMRMLLAPLDITLPIGPFNGSTRLGALSNVGYEREGLMRRSAIKDGEILDQLLYAKVR